ncbi:hypothetical protein V7S43_007682 [Phytophthora oleae]|uniref:Uncharacterized protein n=1 Tax=Phytophthora oleae TaxID=2107226 RepID=A0ABD3FNW4_9STRA
MTASPALCRRNMQWWGCKYGRHNQYKQDTFSGSALDGFYCAIRDNQVDQVQRYIAEHPAAVFTKIFGNNQRTALYIASFFGRHKVVKLLLCRGADKDLLCNGQRPIDVAGFASSDAVDRMKVRSLLQGDACPQLILRLDDKKHSTTGSSTGAASETGRLRVQIHFSEPVNEFTLEDITVSKGCVVTSFSMLRTDLYLATVQLPSNAASSVELSVEIPAGAARAARDGRCSAQSRPLQLAPA